MAARLFALLSLFYFGVNFGASQQDVSADINSPYTVASEEVLLLEVSVTNKGREEATVNVTLDKVTKSFVSLDNTQTQQIILKPGQTTIVTFRVVFYLIGPFTIEVTILNIKTKVTFTIKKLILIKSVGEGVYANNATLIELCDTKEKSFEVDVTIPDNAVAYSAIVVVAVVGNVMGPTIDNLESLIRIPSGCGEQIALNFVPNIVVIAYLDILGTLTPAKKAQAISNIQTGYNLETTSYKHADGSFSAFISDPVGSCWLTAYIVKSFFQASPYITVNVTIIDAALNFIAATQTPSGTFVENGRVIHTELQGGTSTSGSTMTAYIVIAFLVNGRTRASSPIVDKAITYLEGRLPNITESYELAIVTYALHLAGSPQKDAAFTRLVTFAIVQGDQTYYGPTSRPSLLIEATAYVLLTYAYRGDFSGAEPLVRYLVGKKNDLGGYSSSQNTVIALEALAAIALKKKYCDTDLTVAVKYETDAAEFKVNKENALQVQNKLLPNTTRHANIQVLGTGVAIVQVSWHYHLQPRLIVSKRYQITVKVSPNPNVRNSYIITICVRFILESAKYSGMTIIEAESPSGFIFGDENLKQADRNTITEIKSNNTVIYHYLPRITIVEICVTFIVRSVAKVINLKPAYAMVYDYYEPENRVVTFYKLPVK